MVAQQKGRWLVLRLVIRVNPGLQPLKSHGDTCKKPYRNTSVASPFAIPEDFVLGENSEHGLIWAERVTRNNSVYPKA